METEKSTAKEKMSFQLEKTLKTLIELLINPKCLKQELFNALLLVEMKENGFQQLKADGESHITIPDYILSKRQTKDGLYEAVFVLNRFQNFIVKIIVCYLNDVALINATVPDLTRDTYSVCININKYITTSQINVPSNVCDVDELNTTFKDKIVTPMKSVILNHNKSPSGNLSGLPEDAIHQIALKLPLRDVMNMSKVCTRLNYVLKMNRLWARLCKRDFHMLKSDGENWYITYKDMYMGQCEARLRFSRSVTEETFEDFGALSDYTRYGPNSRWEIIL